MSQNPAGDVQSGSGGGNCCGNESGNESGKQGGNEGATPFTEAERATLNAMMDLLIPASRDGRMPAARTLRLYEQVEPMPPRDRAVFRQGIADVEARAQHAHRMNFTQLSPDQARSLVDGLRAERSAFVQSFVTQTVGRYLAHPAVMPLIGLEPRPLWPQGNPVAEGDWSLIEVVRNRPKIYRKI